LSGLKKGSGRLRRKLSGYFEELWGFLPKLPHSMKEIAKLPTPFGEQ